MRDLINLINETLGEPEMPSANPEDRRAELRDSIVADLHQASVVDAIELLVSYMSDEELERVAKSIRQSMARVSPRIPR